mmetsp:Transcript_9747/g.14800  ORF Transcript_9747/g.14800 Transcript_9747/m.14800 type:complete len:606 (+) Transcript_9747:187-2004(+)
MTGFFDANGDPQMDPYAVLKIQSNASDTDIKKAYRTQMLQLHPDKLPPNLTAEEITAVTDKFHIVKDAYEFLTNAQYLTARRLYTAKMASRRAEYERREAFLRRQQNNTHRSSSSDPMPARGNNNMYQQQYSHRHHSHRNNVNRPPPPQSRSHAVPPRRKSENNLNEKYGRSEPNLRQGKSDEPNSTPDYGMKYGRGQSIGRRQVHKMGGVSQARKHKVGADGNVPRGRGRSGGGATANNNNNRASSGRAKRTKSSSDARNKERSQRRARSQPRSSRSKSRQRDQTRQEDAARFSSAGGGESQGSNKENCKRSSSNDHKRRSRQMSRDGERRVRSTSAPARYYSKNKSDKSCSTRRAANKELPEEFFCPLTKRIMKDPVVDNDGHTYEREAIERWLRAQSSSPVTNEYLSLDMLQPNNQLKNQIYKATGKPRSRSQNPRARSKSPGSKNSNKQKNTNRQLVDSYLHEISSNSKLSVSLDFMGICAFSYRKITFVIEVPLEPKSGFFVYSSFDGDASTCKLSEKVDAWNDWLSDIGKLSRVSCVKAGKRTVFTLNGNERDIRRREIFQKTLEYFVEMSLKLHNVLHPTETKVVKKVCLTRTPVAVA